MPPQKKEKEKCEPADGFLCFSSQPFPSHLLIFSILSFFRMMRHLFPALLSLLLLPPSLPLPFVPPLRPPPPQ